MDIIFQNYHKHTYWSNIKVADSATSIEEYCKRAKELGHGIISSVEHGWQGHYIECHQLAEKYGLKFVFGTEAYWVKDRLALDENGHKDGKNCHIVIIAKNENGRQAINDILSQAAIDGYYRQSRIDLELIMSLPADDVIITTACIAFWAYEDSEDIIKQLSNHFKDNFYLEVQYHNTDPQKAINKKILNLHKKYGIKLMMGCDSHYIDEKGALDRDEFIKSKGMEYPDEEGWYMDYPDGNTAYQRFADQCVLSHDEIMEAINNTNVFLEVEEYDCPIFNHDIKMPTLYPSLTQQERDDKLEQLIWDKWSDYKKEVPTERHSEYEEQIRYELDIVKTTFHSDYFLLDYAIAELGKKKGGQLTLTGRGCFVGESLVLTDKGYKCIKDITTEDKVVCKTGEFTEVKDTFKYDIDEELVQVKYLGSCNKINPVVCTSDHKFLVYDIEEEKEEWKPAKNLIPNKDYLCFPKIKNNNKSQDFIDLNQYNVFGFEYDDKYIYEKYESIGKPYKYSPSDVARHLGCGKSVIENYANGKREHFIARNGATDKDVLRYTGFNSAEEYRAYIAHKKLKRINRYIPNDYIMGEFIGMMYGDGFTNVSKFEAGLAINNKSQKNIINRGIFEQIAKRVGMDFYEHTANNGKALSQFYMRSKVFTQYIYEELFISKKGKDKEFNCKFLYESNEIIKGIAEGLFITDGCLGKDNRLSFDNTSLSLIGIYKILHSMCGDYVTGTDVRPEHIDSRGYHSKTSYKVRRLKKGVKETKNYWLLPVKDIVHLPQTQTTVYDISVPYTNSFVLDNCIVHNSGVSFFLNKLLGFTSVDRISAKVKMYPERFMSPTRILETHSLADIDMNVAIQEPFWEAQEELLGYEHSKQMIAYQQLKPAAAWKMYAKAQNVDYDTSNEISKQIAKYLKDYAKAKEEADDDEEIDIDILDYIDEQYKDIYLKSEDYLGVVSSVSPHPCASLVYQGNIRKEIGYIFVKSQSNDGKICCCMDGKWAEKYGFLKNDWLKVNVVEVIYKIFERIGMKPFSSSELIKKCEGDDKVWSLYKQQCTKGLNQVEQPSSSTKVSAYSPQNISELTAFCAAVRPGFKSMYDIFESRQPFSYHINAFDNLLQTDEMPNSFVLYQEQAMLTLNYAGIPMSECYAVIKAISKKRVEEITKNKDVFIDGFQKKLKEEEHIDDMKAEEVSHQVWQIIEDGSRYSFNCVAGTTRLFRDKSRTNYIPTIEEMYKIKHDLDFAKQTNHIPLHSKYLRTYGTCHSLCDNNTKVKKNDIVDIYYMGDKQTYRVTTKSGCVIECTEDHKFPTPFGNKELSELKVGDKLYKKGLYEKCTTNYKFTDGNFENNFPPKGQCGFRKKEDGDSVLYNKFRTICKTERRCCEDCGRKYSDDYRFEVHHEDFDRTNNSFDNYAWLCVSCHKKRHYANGRVKKSDKGYPVIEDEIISIEDAGVQSVYDIEMADPYHTFTIDNGLVVCNCSHAYSVALDSLYEAWLKTYHPLEFYETYLNILNKKGAKDRLNKFKEEAEHYFHITFPPYRFRQDNRTITIDKEHNAINNALSSIKGYSNQIADTLYECGKESNSFIDALKYLNERSIKSAKIIPLIKIGYFSEFGNENTLLTFINYWDMFKQGNAKQVSKEKADKLLLELLPSYATDRKKDGTEAKSWTITDIDELLNHLYQECINNASEPTFKEKMAWQKEVLDYIELTTCKKEDIKRVLILDVKPLIGQYSTDPWCYKVETRSIGTGRTASLNIDARAWKMFGELTPMSIIKVGTVNKNNKGYWYIRDYIKEN